MGFYAPIIVTFVTCSAFSSIVLARECYSLPQNIMPVPFALDNCSTRAHGEVPTANNWGILVTLGSPLQELCVMPSLFTNNTFVPTVEVCKSDQRTSFASCTSRRGGLLDKVSSGGNFSRISAPDDSTPDVNWGAIDPTNNSTQKGDIMLRLPSEVSIPVFPIKTIEGGVNHNVGHLGLSESSPLLQHFSDERGLVKGFGFDAGSQSISNPRDGSLIVGGYDPQRIGAYAKNYTLTNTQTTGRVCSLSVTITELALSRPGVDDLSLISRGELIPACIEPYDTLFRFPNRTLNALIQATNAVSNILPDSSEFLVVEPGLTYLTSVGFNGSLKFTLDHDFIVEIPNEELVHPLRGIRRDGSISVMQNVTEVNIFHESPLLDTAVLGRAFLSRVYLVVEYRSTGPIFRLAEIAPGNFHSDLVPFEPDCTNTRKALNTAEIVGIAVGATFFVVLLAIAVWWWRRRLRLQREAIPGGSDEARRNQSRPSTTINATSNHPGSAMSSPLEDATSIPLENVPSIHPGNAMPNLPGNATPNLPPYASRPHSLSWPSVPTS